MDVVTILAISAFGIATPLGWLVSWYTGEVALCLQKDGDGVFILPLKTRILWLVLSVTHAAILIGVGWVGGMWGIISPVPEVEQAPRFVLSVLCYWLLFEATYLCVHACQHNVPVLAWLTQHKLKYTNGHHALRPPRHCTDLLLP